MYCQKCRTPLKLDGSLEDLNPAAYDLLVAASSQAPSRQLSSTKVTSLQDQQRRAVYDQASSNTGTPLFKRHGALRDNAAMSFIVLSDSQLGPRFPPGSTSPLKGGRRAQPETAANDTPAEPSNEMERIQKLFEILSARSDIDHPICTECTEILQDGLTKRLETATRERDAFIAYLKQKQADAPSEDELKQAEAALVKAMKDEAAALEELKKLEYEKAAVDAELAALEAEARDLDATEEEFWRERNLFSEKLSSFQSERDSLNSRFDHDSQLLEKLQRSNVYNDTFCISHDGTFATINGLRLGKTGGSKNVQVEWPEINAAWGHALLLLVTVAEKLNFRFEGFEPQPMGSTSRIIRLEQPSPASSRLGGHRTLQSIIPPPPAAPKRTTLELFFSADNLSLGRMFSRGRFGDAMVAFLELVRQLGVFVEDHTSRLNGRDGRLRLPYPIKDDRIGDLSIRLGIGQDEAWTKACKLTLTCCKFLLAHASNVSYSTGRPGA